MQDGRGGGVSLHEGQSLPQFKLWGWKWQTAKSTQMPNHPRYWSWALSNTLKSSHKCKWIHISNNTLMCAPPLFPTVHTSPYPFLFKSPPTIYTPILPPSPALSHRDLHSLKRQTSGFLLLSNICLSRMTAVFCPHFIRKSSHSASLLFLLLLAGQSNTIVAGPGRVRAGLEGRARAEGRVRSGVKDKGGNSASIEGNTETGFGDTRVSRPGAAAGEDGEGWGDPGTTTGFRSMLSIGEGGLWEPHSSSRCVPIPSGMALCQNIGYDNMRMPNLLGHESPAEAVQQSASWLPLLARECHPDARIFLCSLFAPICLDR